MRGINVSRVEGISDAIFGLAITLIVVSLQVPKTFDELTQTLRGFLGAAACTAILLQIWNRHYQYFRRYGIEDGMTRVLNGTLLFVVIAYVYPLKFLFNASIDSIFGIKTPRIELGYREVPKLFVIYGLGFALVYLLFGLMYWHALRKRQELELSNTEYLQTRWILGEHLLMGSSGLISVVLALVLPLHISFYAGFAYFLIPIFETVLWSRHGVALRRQQAQERVV